LAICLFAVPVLADDTIRRAGIGEPETLDPHLWVDGWAGNIVQDLFLGLTTLDADARVIPGAAESWDVSPDGRTYTFHLREGLRWSDGVAMDSQDFLWSFRRIMDPATAAPAASLLYMIENGADVNRGSKPVEALGVRAPDARTLVIQLVAPTPYFPELIVHRGFPAPRHVIERHGIAWARPGTLVSNDAFVLDGWVPNAYVRLRRNPAFYDIENVRIDVIEHIPVENQSTGLRMYRAGEIDIVVSIPAAQFQWAKESYADQFHVMPALGLDYYIFNVTRPPFDDARVRRALSIAINRRALTERVLGTGEVPAFGLMPPGIENYPDPARMDFADVPMDERIETARSLLADAGFGPGQPLEFSLRYNTNEMHRRVAVAMAAMWRTLNVRVRLENSENKVLVSDIRAGNFDIARSSWFAEVRDPMTYLELLYSKSGPINQSGYANAEYDALIEKAQMEADLDIRADFMRRAESIGLRDQALLPLNFYVSKRLISPRVGGLNPNVRGIHVGRYFYLRE
jgi:oligopeptide transport system substrate-binding protein